MPENRSKDGGLADFVDIAGLKVKTVGIMRLDRVRYHLSTNECLAVVWNYLMKCVLFGGAS